MFVTSLIKDKKYRQFILERFPKPQGTRNLKSLIKSNSLIGNAFEIYFKLLISKQFDSEINFDEELSSAQRTINSFEKDEEFFSEQEGMRNVYVKQKDLNKIKKLVTSTFARETYKYTKKNGVFRIEVSEKDPLKIFKFKMQCELEVASSFRGNSFIIHCKNDVLKVLENDITRFRKEVKSYNPKTKISSDLLSSILQVANISNIYFSMKNIFYFPTKTELKQLSEAFNQVYNPFALMNFKKMVLKPCLTWQKVRARPDYILDNFILEIKTGKEYLSTDDYLQGITYLLFSYEDSSKQIYGKIEKLHIYYPFISRMFSVEATAIKLSRIDQKIFKEMVAKFYKNGRC